MGFYVFGFKGDLFNRFLKDSYYPVYLATAPSYDTLHIYKKDNNYKSIHDTYKSKER